MCRSEQLHIQSALLYTTQNGERRIRVHNYCIPLVVNIKNIFDYGDSNAISAFLARQMLYKMYKVSDLTEIRNQAIVRTKEILYASRKTNNDDVPDSLAALPMNMLGVLKHQIMCSHYCKPSHPPPT